MSSSRKLPVAVAEGIAVHAAVTAAGLGLLTLWARYWERRSGTR